MTSLVERIEDAVMTGMRGDELLEAVSVSMGALHERYYGRVPVSTRSQMMGDDLLACVLGGVYTEVEKTLIELQRSAIVQETRSAFQAAMQHKFISEVVIWRSSCSCSPRQPDAGARQVARAGGIHRVGVGRAGQEPAASSLLTSVENAPFAVPLDCTAPK